jgi:hypothetical protein
MFIVGLPDGSRIYQEKIENVPGIAEERKARRFLNPNCSSKNPREQDDFCCPGGQFTNPVSQAFVLLGRCFPESYLVLSGIHRLKLKICADVHPTA